VGTPEEIVDAIFEYRAVGVTQLILSGWPNAEALSYFGQEILPRVRAREGKEETCNP
jgi:alkanesulfonate monooxygenase